MLQKSMELKIGIMTGLLHNHALEDMTIMLAVLISELHSKELITPTVILSHSAAFNRTPLTQLIITVEKTHHTGETYISTYN